MRLAAVPGETYCLRTDKHAPWKEGAHIICYRCGFLIGRAKEEKLGSLLDY